MLPFVVLVGVVALSMLVAAGPALTSLARLVVGASAHVCHCQIEPGHGAHASCGCPICVPELGDQEGFGAPEVTGTCGDDDPLFRHLTVPVVAIAGFVIVPPPFHLAPPLPSKLEASQWSPVPELPPPRFLVVTG